MIYGIVFFLLALLIIAVGHWWLCLEEISILKREVALEEHARKTAFGNWERCYGQLEVAQKQIVELRRQSPGRDNSGRFVKAHECESHGSE